MSTIVSSKYGCCGEYRHSLANAVNVYGSNWTVIRLTSGSPIFKRLGPGDKPFPSNLEDVAELRKGMPWNETVLASAIVGTVERSRLIRRSGDLDEKARLRLLEAKDPLEQLEILASDLEDTRHFAPLAAYNHPEHSVHFIAGIEAGRILVRMAEEYPEELRDSVVSLLRSTATSLKSSVAARSASVYFLSQVLSAEEKRELKALLDSVTGSKRDDDGQIDMLGFYEQTYLD